MSPVLVGLLGFTGTVGSALLPPLIEAHKSNKIDLVILHRESSNTSQIPSDLGITFRAVQLDDKGEKKNREAVKDLEVVISALGATAIDSQKYLIEALAGSSKLKTFIPSDFGFTFTEEELSYPALKPLQLKKEIADIAGKMNVPITNVRVGLFDYYFYAYKFAGTDVKENTVEVYHDALKNPLRITSLAYLGHAITQLSLRPSAIAGKTIALYDLQPTGQEIIDVLTKIHGKPTKVTDYTDEQYEKDMGDLVSAISASVKLKWGDNSWAKEEKVEVDGWKNKSFEELTRAFLKGN
ncbi:hypothetical protein I302_105174 [Kwoniella bestiolae CBS 10118]|uniref:NmrA-like domain-containing protein n=1 Tax=Kwoniella bestiolae CBS 10118 TaxID=1296100 RepID=A0A1B9FSE3_9TREE|nr:hypothetical protein I302_08462 [Kwoniella bestiolae CBS 10118]OCF21685.1 hypothetical protein I302_08462 [Kwoniella bestiolae CBS 10118]